MKTIGRFLIVTLVVALLLYVSLALVMHVAAYALSLVLIGAAVAAIVEFIIRQFGSEHRRAKP